MHCTPVRKFSPSGSRLSSTVGSGQDVNRNVGYTCLALQSTNLPALFLPNRKVQQDQELSVPHWPNVPCLILAWPCSFWTELPITAKIPGYQGFQGPAASLEGPKFSHKLRDNDAPLLQKWQCYVETPVKCVQRESHFNHHHELPAKVQANRARSCTLARSHSGQWAI
jgi:hypothetical protein